LTATGRVFLVEARSVLRAAADARQVVAQMQGLYRGTLSIGMIQGLAALLDIPDMLERFRTACPGVEIRLVSGGTLSLIEGVLTGELDLAFTQFIGPIPPGVTAWMLACEPLAAVCARAHPLAGRCDVALSELVAETFVDLHPDWGTRQLIDRSFAENRLSRRIGFEVNDLSTQLDLVAHGLGIALVPKAVIANRVEEQAACFLAVAELAEPEICWELAVVFAHDERRQPISAITRMFLDVLRSSVTLLRDSDAESGAAAVPA
jgi:DNA-binding transcriptional LysR family regulator